MNNKHVLFIDDDPNILDGLQRMLRGMRKEWLMTFVKGAREALDVLEQQHVDVVVSDMRMPDMDGAQLLNEIQARHPEIIRIILSGHADRKMIMSCLGAAHQYLSKPCDADTLKAAVGKAMSLRNLFKQEPSFKPLISRIHTLPSPPTQYQAIVKELQSPNANLKTIAQIIAGDPAMTAKILQLVNSAFFGITHRISSIEQAVRLLGLDMIQALVLSVHVFNQFDAPIEGMDLEQLWRHSTLVGTLARRIALSEGVDEQICSESMVAGLLHDVGKLVLLANLSEQYVRLIKLAQREQADLFELEFLEFGASHAEVGGYLLGLWGLPDAIVEAVAYHHNRDGFSAPTLSPLLAVHVADILTHASSPGSAADESLLELDYLEVWAEKLPAWRVLCQDIMAAEKPE